MHLMRAEHEHHASAKNPSDEVGPSLSSAAAGVEPESHRHLVRAEHDIPLAPAPRPKAWGKLFRREDADNLAAGAAEKKGQHSFGALAGGMNVLFAIALLVGFALQAKSPIAGLLRASG